MPSPLANRPELPAHLGEVWQDFNRLSRSRAVTMNGAPMPIPFEAMDRYWDRFGVGGAQAFEAWMQLIQAADDAYRKMAAQVKR